MSDVTFKFAQSKKEEIKDQYDFSFGFLFSEAALRVLHLTFFKTVFRICVYLTCVKWSHHLIELVSLKSGKSKKYRIRIEDMSFIY